MLWWLGTVIVVEQKKKCEVGGCLYWKSDMTLVDEIHFC